MKETTTTQHFITYFIYLVTCLLEGDCVQYFRVCLENKDSGFSSRNILHSKNMLSFCSWISQKFMKKKQFFHLETLGVI